MRYSKFWLLLILACSGFGLILKPYSQTVEWLDPESPGEVDLADLRERIAAHENWLQDTNTGHRLLLSNIDLSTLNLKGADLGKAGLTNVNFRDAGLTNVDFRDAGLTDINFSSAGLTYVSFSSAGLTDVTFSSAGLTDVFFRDAGLTNVNFIDAGLTDVFFRDAGLTNVDFSDAGLTDVFFSSAGLTDVYFSFAGLTDVTFRDAGLTDVDFVSAGLTNVYFSDAGLTYVSFSSAGLTNVDFSSAGLTYVSFSSAGLTDVTFSSAGLTNVTFRDAGLNDLFFVNATSSAVSFNFDSLSKGVFDELSFTNNCVFGNGNIAETSFSGTDFSGVKWSAFVADSQTFSSFSTATNLHLMSYEASEAGLISLRKGFKDLGMRDEQRDINYAINHQRRNEFPESEWFSRALYWLVEEFTEYGRTPSLPLIWMLILSLIMCPPYMFVIWQTREGVTGGIWILRSEDSVKTGNKYDKEIPSPILLKTMNRRTKVVHSILHGMYFSFMVTFRIGWKDISIGNWITRMDPRGIILRSSGWVRTVSGIQSVLGVILFALFLLSYFSLPLE